ncbi:MAG: histidine phosphatase family protein [Firmicutes bacterium]|nr:histidine phosphatase family protein [Bacillota bacterium]
MTKIYLVRHGETQWNQAKRYQGQTDIPLTDKGREQAQRTAERLADVRASFLISSDLSRALDTAAPIGKKLSLPVISCPLWRERNYGRWEGLTRAEIQELYPQEWQANRENPMSTAPLGGETLAQLRERSIKALDWVLTEYQGHTGIVVSHGGLLRALLAWIDGQDYPHHALDNGGITIVQGTHLEDLELISVNDVSHLV